MGNSSKCGSANGKYDNLNSIPQQLAPNEASNALQDIPDLLTASVVNLYRLKCKPETSVSKIKLPIKQLTPQPSSSETLADTSTQDFVKSTGTGWRYSTALQLSNIVAGYEQEAEPQRHSVNPTSG